MDLLRSGVGDVPSIAVAMTNPFERGAAYAAAFALGAAHAQANPTALKAVQDAGRGMQLLFPVTSAVGSGTYVTLDPTAGKRYDVTAWVHQERKLGYVV